MVWGTSQLQHNPINAINRKICKVVTFNRDMANLLIIWVLFLMVGGALPWPSMIVIEHAFASCRAGGSKSKWYYTTVLIQRGTLEGRLLILL